MFFDLKTLFDLTDSTTHSRRSRLLLPRLWPRNAFVLEFEYFDAFCFCSKNIVSSGVCEVFKDKFVSLVGVPTQS